MDALRKGFTDLLQCFFHLIGDGQRIGAEEFRDRADDSRFSHIAGVASGKLRPETDLRHLFQGYRNSLSFRDHGFSKLFERADPSCAGHHELLPGNDVKAAGHVHVGFPEGLHDLFDRNVVLKELGRGEKDLILFRPRPHGDHRRHARDRQNTVANFPVANRSQIEQGNLVALKGKFYEPTYRRSDREHHRRPGSGRKPFFNLLEPLIDQLPRRIDVGPPLENDDNGRKPRGRLGANYVYSGGAVDCGLDAKGNQSFHVLRRQPGRLGLDHDLRRGKFRQDIQRHPAQDKNAGDEDHDVSRHHQQPVL